MPNTIERTMLSELLNILCNVIVCFTSNKFLLHYLESQPIEEMIQFVGVALKLSGKFAY